MSLSSASLADGSDPPTNPSYAHDDGDADGAPHGRNGSVVAKLFGRNRQQVAVDDDDLQGHANGHDDSDEDESDEDVGDGDIHANGNVHADDDDDEEDDEYVPGSSEEESGESDDEEADVDDLDDEETSVRSLLLPMATYAKQLLFLSEQDDDGEFDDQDAELWESAEEKREWIDRYEATNRAYIDSYGCRIDAPAIPDMKKRLRRERNREAKYSLVLLVFAVAYLIRLLVGPVASPSIDATATVASPVEVVSTPPPSTAVQWTSNGTPWWSVWTKNLVVRVVSWPQSVGTILHSAISAKPRRNSGKAEHSVGDPIRDEHMATQRPPASPTSKNEDTHADTTTIEVQSSGGEENLVGQATIVVIVEEREVIATDSVVVDREVIATVASVTVQDFLVASTHSDLEQAIADEVAPDQDQDLDEEKTRTHIKEWPGSGSMDSASSRNTEISAAQVENGISEVVSHDGSVQGEPSSHGEPQDDHDQVSSLPTEDDALQKSADDSFQRCLKMFYMLVKMKHDASVKTAAVRECDKAVEASSSSTVSQQFKAHLLRGDMKSLLKLFTEANEDYEAALASEGPTSATLRSEIETKITSNRWIEHYHLKRFRELRNDCQQMIETSPTGSTQGSSARVRGLAAEWLRAFRKETPVLEVLTKTRAWTLYRPAMP